MQGLLKGIDTASAALAFRDKSVDLEHERLLVAQLGGSQQEPDITTPINCGGFGRLRHFRFSVPKGWPENPLPIVPACRKLGISDVPRVMRSQVFQLAACPWRCWYCFVPYSHLSADPRVAAWMTCDELVEMYSGLPDRPNVIDLSGGSPDLIPEWPVWMMKALKRFGLERDVYLWSDDNLSTDYLFNSLSSNDLDTLISYGNYGRVCCFKGFDRLSFAFNTRAREEDFDKQFEIARRTLALGLDVYGYVTLTSPPTRDLCGAIKAFIDRLQNLGHYFPLRIVPLQIQVFSPVAPRMNESYRAALSLQEDAVAIWNAELESRYSQSERELPIGSFSACG